MSANYRRLDIYKQIYYLFEYYIIMKESQTYAPHDNIIWRTKELIHRRDLCRPYT